MTFPLTSHSVFQSLYLCLYTSRHLAIEFKLLCLNLSSCDEVLVQPGEILVPLVYLKLILGKNCTQCFVLVIACVTPTHADHYFVIHSIVFRSISVGRKCDVGLMIPERGIFLRN